MSTSILRSLTGAYTIALTYLLLAPEPLFFLGRTGAAIDASISSTLADWIEHGVAYALLAGLLLAAYGPERPVQPIIAAIVHGGVTEVLQHWIPGREGSWTDTLADVSGVAVGLAVTVVWRSLPAQRRTIDHTKEESLSFASGEALREAYRPAGD